MSLNILRCIVVISSLLTTGIEARAMEHAIIVHFQYGSTDLTRLFALEDKLIEAISSAKAGEFDGNEIAADGSDGYLYMYGPDADRLFDVVLPILKSADFMKGAAVTRRYGRIQENPRVGSVTIGAGPEHWSVATAAARRSRPVCKRSVSCAKQMRM
jgi:hypothetical protein